MKKQVITYISASILLISCCPFYQYTVINESNQDLIVKVTYNRDSVKNAYGSIEKFCHFKMQDSVYQLQEMFNCQTLVSEYHVKPLEEISIESRVNARPDFDFIEQLQIIKKDTITYLNSQLGKAFSSERSSVKYSLIVK